MENYYEELEAANVSILDEIDKADIRKQHISALPLSAWPRIFDYFNHNYMLMDVPDNCYHKGNDVGTLMERRATNFYHTIQSHLKIFMRKLYV